MQPPESLPPAKRSSDPAAWVATHGDAMFRYAYLRVRDRDMAEEFVQEAFLAALRSQSSYSGRSSERTWLIGILKHKVIDGLRRKQRSEIEAGGGLEEHFEAGSWNMRQLPWPVPDSDIQRREFEQALYGCVGDLPSPQREALSLCELDDLPGEEVCKILDITPTNLWTLIHRAKLQLRKCLQLRWLGQEESVS
jgi:RNA polymerase sigma-70 factor (ECF subfamily)